MTPRPLVALLLLVATATASAKELSGRELKEFLGPVSPQLITWRKTVEREAETYDGKANPPISGSVRISICDNCSIFGGSGPGEEPIGIFPSFWSKGRGDNREFYAGGMYWINQQAYFEVDIKSELEADRDKLVAEISRLSMFNATPSTPFDGITMRRNNARVVDCLLVPFLFVVSAWLPWRNLRARGVKPLAQALTLVGVSAGWIALFVLTLPVRADPFAGAFHSVFWGNLSGWWVLTTPAIALACLVIAVLIVVWLLLRRFVISRFATPA